MEFPINIPLVSIEIKEFPLADTKPTPTEGYEIVLVKDLTWTKLWMVFKIVQ